MKRFIFFAAALIISLSWLAPQIAQGQSYQTIRAQENLYLVGDRTFSLFYITSKGVVVIDPINAQHAKATKSAIDSLTDKPVTHVIYSHNHWDHISGGSIFKNQGATFISHRKAKQHISPNKDVVLPDTTWSGPKNILQLGAQTLELYYYGYNHGNGMTVVRFPEHNAVFIADLVVPDRILYTYLPDASPKNWVNDLKQIQQLNFDEAYFSHVRAIGDRSDVELMQQYFEDLYAAVEQELAAGTPFFEIPRAVEMPKYAHLKNYDKWLHMNAWRILMEKSIGQ